MLGIIINGIRIIAIVVLAIIIVINYIFIMLDNEAYFENRVIMFLHGIFLALILIFLVLL